MRFLVFFLLTLACVAFQKQTPVPGDAEYIAEDSRLAQLVDTPGPAITLQGIDGTLIDLADSYGKKPIYLKLWASYCIPCRAQMPKFEKIYESVGDRIQVIAVDAGVGDDAAKVASFVAKTGMHMPIIIDDGSLGAWLKMDSTPLHLLIGRDGRIAFAGHQDGPELDAAIQRVLNSPAPRKPVETVAVNRLTAIKLGDAVPAITLTGSNGSKVELKGGDTGHPGLCYSRRPGARAT
jgi:thiol-disulfide isomerase/thioredoxin